MNHNSENPHRSYLKMYVFSLLFLAAQIVFFYYLMKHYT